jgi:hypothetical protein
MYTSRQLESGGTQDDGNHHRRGLKRPIDVGPLRPDAQQLEHLGLLHIVIQQPLGPGFASVVKLLP